MAMNGYYSPPNFKKKLVSHIESLFLVYPFTEDQINECFIIYEWKTLGECGEILYSACDTTNEDMLTFVDSFYIIAIKAFNVYMEYFDGFDLPSWFDEYMDTQYFEDLQTLDWIPSCK